MKITFVLPHCGLAGGIRVISIYAERLRQRGHDLTIVSTPERPVTPRERFRSILRARPIRKPCAGGSHFDGLQIKHVVIDSDRPITNDDVPDADVVVASWWQTAEWVSRLRESKGAKFHFIQHYEMWGGPKERVDAVWRLPLHRVVVSKWLKQLAEEQFNDNEVAYIPNSVDHRQFFADVRAKQAVPTLGFIYSTAPFKAVEVAMKAISILRQNVPNLKIVSFGADPPSAMLPLPQGTEFVRCPPQDSIRDIYAKCDVWLCTSRTEGFGLPALEAMACRTPVVATRAGGFEDTVEHGENGFLVPVGNAAMVAQRAQSLLESSPAVWRQFSDAAYSGATRYSWDDATELWEATMHRFVAERELIAKQLSIGAEA